MARTALVTGASSGIGEALARQLAERGDDLVLVARNEGRLQALADDLGRHYGIKTEVIAADLSNDGQLATVEKRVRDDQQPIDLLVKNAGFGSSGRFSEMPIDGEVNEVELNVVALVRLTPAALEQMLARRQGAVLNVGSVAGFQPAPTSATYAATKAFVASFSQAIHEEVKASGVKVSCLCPGFTRTRFHERAEMEPSKIPGPLWLDADDVARAGIAGVDKNMAVIVPGAAYKAAVVGSRLMPQMVVRKIRGIAMRGLCYPSY